jgi:RNA polymerase-binding transcription factor DksA
VAPWSAVVFSCGQLSLDDDGDRVRCAIHPLRRAGVRAVRDRRGILADETGENTMNDKRARELVARERARIEQSLRELNAEVTAEGELHQQQTGEASEAGTDLDREEIDIALVADLREELKAVGRAEARIAVGRYGRSIDTGAQIPDERLEAAPLAERTIEEQRRVENGVG